MITVKRVPHKELNASLCKQIRTVIDESFGDNNLEMIFLESLSDNEFINKYVQLYDEKDVYWWLVFNNHNIITLAMCHESIDSDSIFVSNVCTRMKYRRKGYGKLLFTEMKIDLFNRNKYDIKFIKGEVNSDNKNAIRFYKKIGAKLHEKQNEKVDSNGDVDSNDSYDPSIPIYIELNMHYKQQKQLLKQLNNEKERLIQNIIKTGKVTQDSMTINKTIFVIWISCILMVVCRSNRIDH